MKKALLLRGLVLCLIFCMMIPYLASCAQEEPQTPVPDVTDTEPAPDTQPSDTGSNTPTPPVSEEEPDTPEYPMVSAEERYTERTLSLTTKQVSKRIKADVVAGKNKVSPDFASALWRLRNVVAPKNAQRLNRKTPCAAKGDKCYDCDSPERICRALVVNYKKINSMDVEVILVDQELGF